MLPTSSQRIKNIVVVGGGTAGWLSAAYLNKALNRNQSNFCRITLIESNNIPTVGVGEGTIFTLKETFEFLEIPELEWMVRCNATYKLAIKFVNWSNASRKDMYWHPFGGIPIVEPFGFPLSHYWLARRNQGNSEPYGQSCSEHVHLCEAQKAPKSQVGEYSPWDLEYAYHLDAGLLASFLKEKSLAAGVNHIIDRVKDVALDERGFIDHLITENHGDLDGDLFIDCSGFRGVLINQSLQEPFVSYNQSLICDRAIAISTPYPIDDKFDLKNGGINPYTTSTAMSSGWIWHTPLVSRGGNGYVYSNAFISDEDAEKELRKHLGIESEKLAARHLKMRVGKTRNSWVKNCVSIGLSGGFVEPLEASGIYLIEAGLESLVHHFPDLDFAPSVIASYNQTINQIYEEIRDFIVMHYCLSKRDDTAFWQANVHDLIIPDTLKSRLELWQHKWHSNPSSLPQPIGRHYPGHSYTCILEGMNCLPTKSLPILAYQDNSEAEKCFSQLNKMASILKTDLPNHSNYLEKMHSQYFQLGIKKMLAIN